jgi:LDH2 family malate/lactate/ureidoglycolate dehydrogenase
MLPGDPQIICAEKRMKYGIPLDQPTFEALTEMSINKNVKLELF